jgi:hypothetical protein
MKDVGTTIGNNSQNTRGTKYIGKAKASGWEIDTKNGPGSQGLGCNAPPPNALPSTLPPNVLVVASAKGPNGEAGADMTYYDRLAGGSVFATGSITFGGSLYVDANAAQVVKNVLTMP